MINPPRRLGSTGWTELFRHPQFMSRILRGISRAVVAELRLYLRRNSTDILPSGYTFADALERRVILDSSSPVLRIAERTYTALECDQTVNKIARYLQSQGVTSASRVGLMLNNNEFYIFSYLALQKLKAIAIRINTGLIGDGFVSVLQQSEPDVLVLENCYVTQINEAYSHMNRIKPIGIPVLLCRGDDMRLQQYLGRRVSIRASEIDAKLSDRPFIAVSERNLKNANRIIEIKFTSGTSGPPKPIVVRANAPSYRFLSLYSHVVYEPGEVIFSCLPLFHDMAMMMSFGAALWNRCTFALAPNFSATHFWSQVRESEATSFNATGAMIAILISKPPNNDDKKHKVNMVLGSACPKHLWRAFEERFGVRMWEGYGASDSGGFGVINMGNAPPGSIGRALSRHAVVDENNRIQSVGKVGELIFFTGKSKNATDRVEYLNHPSKIIDGWLRTGDLMYIDEKGYLFFSGRKSDYIRRRGENVSAFEIESTILKSPMVSECAAYPVPSDLAEDDIMIAIVRSDAGLQQGKDFIVKEVIGLSRSNLPRFSIPRYIRVLNALPRTPMEKINKILLINEGVTDDSYDTQYSGSGKIRKVKEAVI